MRDGASVAARRSISTCAAERYRDACSVRNGIHERARSDVQADMTPKIWRLRRPPCAPAPPLCAPGAYTLTAISAKTCAAVMRTHMKRLLRCRRPNDAVAAASARHIVTPRAFAFRRLCFCQCWRDAP